MEVDTTMHHGTVSCCTLGHCPVSIHFRIQLDHYLGHYWLLWIINVIWYPS